MITKVLVDKSHKIQVPEPYRVWTALPPSVEPLIPEKLIHHENAFLEDRGHDWEWNRGELRYFSRCVENDEPAWLFLHYISPCPFCGIADSSFTQKMALSGTVYEVVVCRVCDIHGPKGKSRPEAVENWNTRFELDAMKVLNELGPWMSAGYDEVCPELRATFEKGLAVLSGQIPKVEPKVRLIANLVHNGGLLGLDESQILNTIRRLTTNDWDKSPEAKEEMEKLLKLFLGEEKQLTTPPILPI